MWRPICQSSLSIHFGIRLFAIECSQTVGINIMIPPPSSPTVAALRKEIVRKCSGASSPTHNDMLAGLLVRRTSTNYPLLRSPRLECIEEIGGDADSSGSGSTKEERRKSEPPTDVQPSFPRSPRLTVATIHSLFDEQRRRDLEEEGIERAIETSLNEETPTSCYNEKCRAHVQKCMWKVRYVFCPSFTWALRFLHDP